jgi:hypothetical protein
MGTAEPDTPVTQLRALRNSPIADIEHRAI